MKRATAIIVLTLAVALISLAQSSESTKAPTLALRDLHGKTVNLGDFKGKVVLLNFWATWCVPCRAEVPQLVRWQDEYKDKLQIVGITYPPTSSPKVRVFVRTNKIGYPVLLGKRATKRLFDNSANLPITIVIDREGNIAARIVGVIFDDEFRDKVLPLLR
ncbi:MAG TPA: TlpA disulfide reductase family protein [Pyrinomonadaceae bacterium]|jgi:thiol-disulfide isomerase/thioredoxin